jgi:signal transduction histidine kinase
MNTPRKILIIDDENDHIDLIRRELKKNQSYIVETASTVNQAINLLKTSQPEIILSDFRLPDGDARAIIKEYAGILPVIIMTSFGNEALAVELIKSGALDYIVKTQENFSNLGWYIERSLREWKNMEERKKVEEELRKKNELLSAVNQEMVLMVEELKISREKAVESDRLKSAFLANMSHEIRTPMNGILGFANLLSENELSEEERAGYVEIINECGNQLLVILNDLIDIAKIEANQLTIDIKPVQINTLLNDLHTLFSAKVAPEILFTAKPGLADQGDPIKTDPVRLKQILTNLVSNAIKFTNTGSITFGYEVKNDLIEFYVRDTGIGISPEQKEMIFQRFTQADVSVTRMYGGTGLGLAISKALVELLGGELWVESEPGKGSCFSFTIPFVPVSKLTDIDLKEDMDENDQFLRTA